MLVWALVAAAASAVASAQTPAPAPTSQPAPAVTPTPAPTPRPDPLADSIEPDADTSPVSGGNWLDRTYRWVTTHSEKTVTKVDSLFIKGEPQQPDDWVQVRLRLWLYDEKDKDGFKPEVSATVPLPNLERRLNVYADNLAHNVLPGTDPTTTERQVRVGSRASLFGGGTWRVTSDVGVGYSSGFTAHSEVRFRAWWEGDDWHTTVIQTAFWTTDDRLGELTQVTYDKRLSDEWYLRLQAAGKYTQDKGEWRSSEVARIGWVLDPYRHYLAGMVAFFSRGGLSDEYRAELTYRVRVYRPWMFLEITPLVRYPRSRDFELTWGYRVGLDLFFGGVPKL